MSQPAARRAARMGPVEAVIWAVLGGFLAECAAAVLVGITVVSLALWCGVQVVFVLPPGWFRLDLGGPALLLAEAVARAGPLVFAAVIAVLGVRWWVGPVLGWLLGSALGAFLLVTPSAATTSDAILVPAIWVAAGLAGGFVASHRRGRDGAAPAPVEE